MSNQLFEVALGIQSPWFMQNVDFDETKRQLTIGVDFVAGSRFTHDAVKVVANHFCHFLHGFNFGAHHIGTPVGQHGGNDIDLLALLAARRVTGSVRR